MRTKKNMFNKSVEDMVTKAVKEPMVHSKTADRILNSVEPQFGSLAMQVSRIIPA